MPSTTDVALAPAEPMGTSSGTEAVGDGLGDGRRAGAAHDEAQRPAVHRRQRRRRRRAEDDALRRQGDGTDREVAVDPQADVHGPVGPRAAR